MMYNMAPPKEFLPAWVDGKYLREQVLYSFEGRTEAETRGFCFPVQPMHRPDLVALGWRWGLLQRLFACEGDVEYFARTVSSGGTTRGDRDRYSIPMVLPDEDPATVLPQLRDLWSIDSPGFDCGGTGTDAWSKSAYPQDCVDWVWQGDEKIARFRKKGWGSFRVRHVPMNGSPSEVTKVLTCGVAVSPQELQYIMRGADALADAFPTCARKCHWYAGEVIRHQPMVCSLHPEGIVKGCEDYQVVKPMVKEKEHVR